MNDEKAIVKALKKHCAGRGNQRKTAYAINVNESILSRIKRDGKLPKRLTACTMARLELLLGDIDLRNGGKR